MSKTFNPGSSDKGDGSEELEWCYKSPNCKNFNPRFDKRDGSGVALYLKEDASGEPMLYLKNPNCTNFNPRFDTGGPGEQILYLDNKGGASGERELDNKIKPKDKKKYKVQLIIKEYPKNLPKNKK